MLHLRNYKKKYAIILNDGRKQIPGDSTQGNDDSSIFLKNYFLFFKYLNFKAMEEQS